MKKLGIAALTAVVLAGMAPTAWAEGEKPQRERPERGVRRGEPGQPQRMGQRGRRRMGQGFDLTEDQHKKTKQIMDAARAEAEDADSPEAKREIMQKAWQKVVDTVLSADQKAAWEKAREAMKQRRQARHERLVKELKLTEDQAEKVQSIFQDHAKAIREWHAGNMEPFRKHGEQMRAALKAKDLDKIQELREQMAEFGKGRKELHEALLAKLDAVLDDEQMAKAKRFLQPKPRHPGVMRGMRALRGADLSEEQRKQVEEIMAAAHEAAKEAQSPEDKAKIMKEAWEKVLSKVLTDEQRKKLQKRGPKGGGRKELRGGPDLSDDQKARIREILQQARKDAAEAEGAEAKKEILQAAHEKIVNDVLTAEQREKWEKVRPERGGRRGGGRGRPGSGRGPNRQRQRPAEGERAGEV